MKKTFVSLSFSATHLQVLELNGSKTHVSKSGTVDIPSGVIENYKVKDTAKMAQIIKGAYKQFGIREKVVGIVVPEFSTYTRTLTLPSLAYKELDEAVNWKMKEYLPDNGAGMVMDWKIINRSPNSNTVLVIAISEIVLSSYVVSAEYAGLFPLVVETPALSLARLVETDTDPKIAIYANGHEGLILYLRGKEILGSVVSHADDPDSLVKLTDQMKRHYVETPAKKLLLGGLDITEGTMKILQEKLNLPVEWFKTNLVGITPSIAQQYLIPISLQFKDPAAPADETTINLLPKYWAKNYKDKHSHSQIWLLVMISCAIALVCFMATMGANLTIQQQLTNLKNQQSESESAPEDLVKSINNVNTKVDDILKITNITHNPITVMNSVSSAKPNGVTVNTLNVDLEEGTVTVSGVAADRQSLVDFKNKLEENEDFGNVDIPLASLQRDVDLPFDLNFEYLPAVPKKATPPPKLKQ